MLVMDDGQEHHNGGGFDSSGGIQLMGIVNALKTGDMYIDLVIAMLIPIFFRFLFGAVSKLDTYMNFELIKNWWRKRNSKHERFITYRYQRTSWGASTGLDSDTRNTVLLKAIQLYLFQVCKLNLRVADIDLTTLQAPSSSTSGYYSDSDDEDDEGGTSKTVVGSLSKYKIVKKPPKDVWHKLGTYGSPPMMVEMQITEVDEDSDDDKKKDLRFSTKQFHFVSEGANAIDGFIESAYNWYIDQLRSMADNARYLYELRTAKSSSSDDDGGDVGLCYNRYRLSDEKTFNSLFFRQKKQLLNIVNHFQNKTGKYSIPGYPHKLGLLLYGPPGTGKTSLIKALAQQTGRSIVNVPLSKITTNSELMDIFFQKKYQIVGQDVPISLGFKDVIYIMEDVDSASKIVKRRDGKSGTEEEEIIPELPQPKSAWQMLLESNNEDCRELVNELMEKSPRLKTAALESDVLQSLAQRMRSVPGLGLVGMTDEVNDGDTLARVGQEAVEMAESALQANETVDRFVGAHAQSIKALLEKGVDVTDAFVDVLLGVNEGVSRRRSCFQNDSSSPIEKSEESSLGDQQDAMMLAALAMSEETKSKDGAPVMGPSLWSRPKKDELNLTGLLNVLDGVVDTPGRLLVMTTNHPDMLDPALIRPGRIEKRIMLGYMETPDVVGMLQHYFQTTLTAAQEQRVHSIVAEIDLTPAQIEQMTAESDELDEMLDALDRRAGRGSTAATSPVSTISGM